jgi:hypothetical protein
MKEIIIRLDKSNLNITQKLEGVKFMELPRSDYRMMRADLMDEDLGQFEAWLRGEVSRWLKLKEIPKEASMTSLRDGGFTIPAARELQATMAIRDPATDHQVLGRTSRSHGHGSP